MQGDIEHLPASPSAAAPERWQRAVDIAGSLCGLIVLSPLFLALAAAIKLHDHGSVFYRATRVGKEGRLFRLYKFRTMIPGADQRGGGITIDNDTRITPAGKLLRRFKLDEFPQLLNVIKGEMSLVGPRPEDPRYVALYTPEQREVLRVRPGITSLASLEFKDEAALLQGAGWEEKYVGEIMPKKLASELRNLPYRSVVRDFKIVVRTLGGVIR